MIDITDLVLIKKIQEIPVGAVVYRKDEDGFHASKFMSEEEHEWVMSSLQFIFEKRLYRRISKPWYSFE